MFQAFSMMFRSGEEDPCPSNPGSVLRIVILLKNHVVQVKTKVRKCSQEAFLQQLTIKSRIHCSLDVNKPPKAKSSDAAPDHHPAASMLHPGIDILWFEGFIRPSSTVLCSIRPMEHEFRLIGENHLVPLLGIPLDM
jgi:hypothetical protein